MSHAPFRNSDGRFNLAKDLSGDITDRPAKFTHSCGGIPVQHLVEGLPVQLRFKTAAGLQAVGDAGRGGFPEGGSDTEIIILGKCRAVHAVADIPGRLLQ